MTPHDMVDPTALPLPEAEIAITQAMIDGYAAISGDYNPIHVDPVAAAASPFGGTIAHGCIPMEPIFSALQRQLGHPVLPPGSTMSLRYHRPSRPGDTIRIERKPDASGRGSVSFVCLNQNDQMVIEGLFTLPEGDAPP